MIVFHIFDYRERYQMPRLIAIIVYELDEACDELATRTGWYKKYSRERVRVLIKTYLPHVEKAGKRYFVTEDELNLLASKIQTKKRRMTKDLL